MVDSILYNCVIGSLIIEASSVGIRRIKFNASSNPETHVQKNRHLEKVEEQLNEYFGGHRKKFDVALDWEGTSDFYQNVWKALLDIPYGSTVAYADIASAIGSPKAVRAVGMANSKNPIPILVPCHRVIGKSGQLHGFTGGLHIKAKLLSLENPLQYSLQKEIFRN